MTSDSYPNQRSNALTVGHLVDEINKKQKVISPSNEDWAALNSALASDEEIFEKSQRRLVNTMIRLETQGKTSLLAGLQKKLAENENELEKSASRRRDLRKRSPINLGTIVVARVEDRSLYLADFVVIELDTAFTSNAGCLNTVQQPDGSKFDTIAANGLPVSVFRSAFPLSTTQHFLGLTLILALQRATHTLHRVFTGIRAYPHTHCSSDGILPCAAYETRLH